MLSINEAGAYFNISVKKMRRLAENNLGTFAVYSGNRYLIIRTKFKEFLQNNPMI
ncbi:MAG: excisionase [Faecalimonas umbilicata]|nr:excisionase [Faecalimonas umbilicata]MDY4596084.1 excisionase [Faecalimonas umbilicata]